MKNKLFLLLALLMMGVGRMWAGAVVTSVKTTALYTLKCIATDHTGNLGDNGTTLQGRAAIPTHFRFVESGTDGMYYIQSALSGKYINAGGTTNGSAISFDAEASTKWRIDVCQENQNVAIRPEGTSGVSLNNNGDQNATCPYLKVGPHSDAGNGCSTWVLTEYEDIVTGENSSAITEGWYQIEIGEGSAQKHSTYKGYYLHGVKNNNWGITLTSTPDTDPFSWIYVTKVSDGNYTFTFNKNTSEQYTVGQNSTVNNNAGQFQFNARSNSAENYQFTIWGGNNRLIGWTINDIASIGNTTTSSDANNSCYFIFHKKENPVTYIFPSIDGNGTFYYRMELSNGADAANNIPAIAFFNPTGIEGDNSIVDDDNRMFTVKGEWSYPIPFNRVMRLHGNNHSKWLVFNESNNRGDFTTSADGLRKDCYWYFSYNGMTLDYRVKLYLHTLVDGSKLTLANANNGTQASFGNVGTVLVCQTNGNGFALTHPDNNNACLNDFSSTLKIWNDVNSPTSNGSRFHLKIDQLDQDLVNATTTGVVENSKFLGEEVRPIDAEKKQTAIQDPTPENVNALFKRTFSEYETDGKYYVLKNQNRNTSCYVTANTFAIKNGSITADNNPRQMITNATAADAASLWQFVPSGNGYKIKHVNSGLCLYNGTTNNQGIDMPISEQYAGTYIPENVEGKWWRIRRDGQNLWVHQGNDGWQWRTLLYNAEPSMTNCQASLWSLEEVTTLPVTVSAALYASVCFPVDVEIPEGVDAYYATATSEGKMTLKKIDGAIPARTGVVLKAEEAKTYDFPITTGAGNIEDNLLKGSTITRKGFTEDGFYALGNKEGIGFYLNGSGTTAVPANKAYMESSATTSGVRMEFSFADDNLETSIQELLETEMTKDASIYDLSGRKLNGLQKGINIVNGKKVIR